MDEFGWADMARVAAVYSTPLIAVSAVLWSMFRFSFKAQNDKMDAGFKAQNDKMDAGFAAMNDKFQSQNEKMDAGFAAMNDKFQSQNEKMDAGFKSLNDKIDKVEKTLNEKIDANTSSIEYLGRQVAGTKERIAHIEGKLGLPTPDPEQA